MITYRDVELKDKEFILNAHLEINKLSNLDDSTFENNIDKDVFEDKVCKVIIALSNNEPIGFVLYSYMYWSNCGRGIYLSQAYVSQEYRRQGILKNLLNELERRESDCRFITNLVGDENTVMINSLNKLGFKSSDLITYYRMIK